MRHFNEEFPHSDPWWSCLGCWRVITFLLLGATAAGFALRNISFGR